VLRKSVLFLVLSLGLLWTTDQLRHASRAPLDPLNLASLVRERAARLDELVTNSFESIQKNPLHPDSWPESDLLFVYSKGDSILSWNKTKFPIPSTLPDRDTVRFFSNADGSYLHFSKRVDNGGLIIAVAPLVYDVSMEGKIQKRIQNEFLFDDLNIQISSPGRPDSYPIGVSGKEWFRVNFTSLEQSSLPAWYHWAGFLLGILLLFIFFNLLIQQIVSIGLKTLVATIFIFLVRVLMLWREFPGTSGYYDFLNPQFFASAWFNDSPLEFLLNSLALFLLAIWIKNLYPLNQDQKRKLNKPESTWVVTLLALIVIIGLFILIQVWTDALYHHARISLDFRFLPDWNVTSYFLIASLLLCLAAVVVLLLTFQSSLAVLIRTRRKIFFKALILTASIWFGYQWLADRPYTFTITIGLIVVFLLFGLPVRFYILSRRYSPYFFWYVVTIALAAQMASMVWRLEEERMVKDLRFRIQPLEEQRDLFLEFLGRSAAGKIRRDESIRVMAEGPFFNASLIENKVREFHLEKGFLELNPEVKYLTADSARQLNSGLRTIPLVALERSDSLTIFSSSNTNGDQFSAGYFFLIPLNNTVGSFLGIRMSLPLNLTRILPYFRAGTITDYAFAVIGDSSGVRFTQGRFDYSALTPTQIRGQVRQGGFQMDDWYHLAGTMGDHRLIVASVSNPRLKSWLTNFSFWLIIFLVAMLLLRFNWKQNLFSKEFSYATRIQFYVFTGMLIPLFFVVVVVVRNVSNEHIKELTALRENLLLRTASNMAKNEANRGIGERLNEFSAVNGFPMVWYGTNDFARTASDEISAPFLPSWDALRRLYGGAGVVSIWEDGDAGEFMNSYALVRSESSGEVMGVLSLPLTDPLVNIKAERMEAMASVLRVAVPFMVVFLALSAILSRRLIKPVKRISKALQATSLEGPTRKIQPEGSDELGNMLEAYNTMLDKLEYSRKVLAEKERESLWREMARRVAHEIRNPLTPIKLSLQRLQLQLRRGEHDVKQSTETIESVLHQTEILSNIAGSFSDLAKMPELRSESFDAIEAMHKIIPGLSGIEKKFIRFDSSNSVIKVYFDRSFFSRMVTNLVLNAFQSDEGRIDVVIKMEKISGGVQFTFTDNGPGIPLHIQEQIFKPYFTTKKDGTGLGLTMIKQAVEQVGGKISFESSPGTGSTFSVVLPSGEQ